jgi:hypothetical protein
MKFVSLIFPKPVNRMPVTVDTLLCSMKLKRSLHRQSGSNRVLSKKRLRQIKKCAQPEVLRHYGDVITELVIRLNTLTKSMEERTTYERAFLQIMNLWREDKTAREFVFSRRLAQIAADLMGVDAVRLYHDQALYKEPSGGFTPLACRPVLLAPFVSPKPLPSGSRCRTPRWKWGRWPSPEQSQQGGNWPQHRDQRRKRAVAGGGTG